MKRTTGSPGSVRRQAFQRFRLSLLVLSAALGASGIEAAEPPPPGGAVTEAWRFEMAGPGWSSAAVGPDGTVYVGAAFPGNRCYAFRSDGTLKWSYATQQGVWSSPALGLDGTVYFTSSEGKLYAFTAEGTLKWLELDGDAPLSSPAVATDGTVYFGSGAARICAVDGGGKQKWAYRTLGAVWGSPSVGADGAIYCGASDGKLYALRPDGSLRWAFYYGSDMYAAPAIGEDGTLYFGAFDGVFYALTPSGSKLWQVATGGEIWGSAAIGPDGSVYVGVGKPASKLLALTPTGQKRWEFGAGNWGEFSGVYSTPAITDQGLIWLGAYDRNVYVLDGNGHQQGVFTTDGWVFSSPALSPAGVAYVASSDARLYALTLTNGGGGLATAPWPKFRHDAANSGAKGLLPPVLTQQPEDRLATEGEDVQLRAAATGSPWLAYQWQFNGADLLGATNAVLTLAKVQVAQSGLYRVRVRDLGGTVISRSVTLQVLSAPRLDWEWTARHPLMTTADFLGVCYGAGQFVAVGSHGAVFTSEDAEHWVSVVSGASADLQAVTFAMGQYVAVGNGGTILTSTDAQRWQRAPSPTTDTLTRVQFGNNRFVALAPGGASVVSTNGQDWSRYALSPAAYVGDLAFGNNTFVAAGSVPVHAWYESHLFASTDGRQWVHQMFEANISTYVTHASFNGRFILADSGAGGVQSIRWVSDDGLNWRQTALPLPAYTRVSTYDQGVWLAGSYGKTMISTNGGATGVPSDLPGGVSLRALALGGGRAVAVGEVGAIAHASIPATGGVAWTKVAQGPQFSLADVAYGNARFIAVGDSGSLVSTDGRNWAPMGLSGMSAIIFAEGRFTAAGANSTAVTSADGARWETVVSGGDYGYLSFSRVAYGAGRYVAITPLSIRSWPGGGGKTYSTSQGFGGLAFGNGTWLVGGYHGGMETSRDGLQWTRSRTRWLYSGGEHWDGDNDAPFVTGLAYGNGRFVAACNGAFYASEDGQTWRYSDFSLPVADVQFSDGVFYALGGVSPGPSGLAASRDGLRWTFNPFNTTSIWLNGMAVANGQFVVVGSLGAVFEATAVGRPRLVWSWPGAPALPVLRLENTRSDHRYELEASPDFIHWELHGASAGAASPVTFTNVVDPAQPRRWFRAVTHP